MDRLKHILNARPPANVKSEPDEAKIRQTLIRAKQAFYQSDRQRNTSYPEFLFCQFLYLKKRWWLLQIAVLLLIWRMLILSDSVDAIRRYIGGLAPVFAMLIIPELWRSRRTDSLEIEGAAFYSLRQIYTARMLLFAMTDTLLLVVFSGLATYTERISLFELTTQFFFPLCVTCCICFRFLCSRFTDSEYYAVALSIFWSGIWIFLIMQDEIYRAVLPVVWIGLTAISVLYLAWLIRRVCLSCDSCMEMQTLL